MKWIKAELSLNEMLLYKAYRSEVVSLKSEGYIECGALSFGGIHSTSLRHSRNGNRVIVIAHAKQIDIKKNGNIVKTYQV